MFIYFLASFILIFGFYLVKEHGFWPLNLSINIYKEILGDVAKAAQGQTDGFIALRFVLIGICAAILILGIIARVYYRKDREKGLAKITENTKGFANAAITLSSIGIGVSSAMIAIVSSL